MGKKYETQETEPQMVSEPAMTYGNQYTINELHHRIALSEDEFDNGQYSTHAEVSKQIDKILKL